MYNSPETLIACIPSLRVGEGGGCKCHVTNEIVFAAPSIVQVHRNEASQGYFVVRSSWFKKDIDWEGHVKQNMSVLFVFVFVLVNGHEIMSKVASKNKSNLKTAFEEVEEIVLFIYHLHQ